MFETAPTRCRFRGAIHNFAGLAESFHHPRAVVRPRYTTGRRRLLWPTRRRSTPSRHSAPWSRKGLETWHCFRRSRGRDKSASHSRAANLTNVSSTAWRSKLERLMTLSTSPAAACCSCASFSSRVSRAISVGPRGAERDWQRLWMSCDPSASTPCGVTHWLVFGLLWSVFSLPPPAGSGQAS
jgi:hypothetical protein